MVFLLLRSLFITKTSEVVAYGDSLSTLVVCSGRGGGGGVEWVVVISWTLTAVLKEVLAVVLVVLEVVAGNFNFCCFIGFSFG